MNPIDKLFSDLRRAGKKAFIPFIPAGDPDLPFTMEAIEAVSRAGASLIEVGFPFSDPIADGPVIQASYTRALNHHLKLADLFDALKSESLRSEPTPLVGMVSYSLIWRQGPTNFLTSAKAAGLSGLVVPDLPVEESEDFAKLAGDAGVALTLLVAPTTSPHRAEKVVAACTGFVYVVSTVGITGARDLLPMELKSQIARLRQLTDLPLCVGFGVSRPDHVRELKEIADGVIVGSALTKLLEPTSTPSGRTSALTNLRDLVSNLSAALG
ncbi:MAG TPA: tryptophan synthase subunit alpha [Fimbriiglobus sp.]|jgi:tryptophan synthase alpha chain